MEAQRTPRSVVLSTGHSNVSIDRALALAILLVLGAVGCSRSHQRSSPDARSPATDGGVVVVPDAAVVPDAGVVVLVPDAGVPPGATGRTLSAGAFHTCALGAGRAVWCWGRNDRGQLGDGTTTDRAVPTPVVGLGAVVEISAGPLHTCARLGDGTVRCWGENTAGALGDGTTTDSAVPVEVVGLSDAVELSLDDTLMPDSGHSCARRASGEVVCWGNNSTGQLGDGTTTSRSVPAPVALVSDSIAVASGRNHACALRADRTVVCWGYSGYYGALGDGTTNDSLVPVAVVGLGPVTAITAGEGHSCALGADGSVWCWGWGDHGALGDGSGLDRALPVSVTTLPRAIAIDAGSYSTCATVADGTARCWGMQWLGGGSRVGSNAPVTVLDLSGVTEITAGGSGGCARIADGAIRCWGWNGYGQVGDGTTTDRAAPVPVELASP